MQLEERISAFHKLGETIRETSTEELNIWSANAQLKNPWFVQKSVQTAVAGISRFLDDEALRHWTSQYPMAQQSRTVGIAMAGNIPLVGFHDLLCVLVSGHRLKAKVSSQDEVLIKKLIGLLLSIEPRFSAQIEFADQLKQIDAAIATGSDNTARYFEYYFRNLPHIIRKNRSSCAILMGEESADELTLLGNDVFSYFGLGCRNVSKLYVPSQYNFTKLLDAWAPHHDVINHHKYANNYDYQKSILLVNRTPFFDNGFALLQEQRAFVSPISVVFFEQYEDQADLKNRLTVHAEKIQCVASANAWYAGSVPFGKTQQPALTDYADNVDTMQFLSSL